MRFSPEKKKKERRTRAGAPTAVGHGSLLVSRLAARTPSEDLLLWRREPASSLNVSPSSCSRTAQHICFLYNVLLRRSPSFAIFSCTFHPRPSRDCLQLPTGHSCGHFFLGGGGVGVVVGKGEGGGGSAAKQTKQINKSRQRCGPRKNPQFTTKERTHSFTFCSHSSPPHPPNLTPPPF